MRDHVERDLLCQMLRLDRVIDVDRAGLVEQFVHRGAPGAGHRLIGGDDHPLDPGDVVQRLQRDDHLDCRAVRVGDDVSLLVLPDRLRIDLRHDQRHVGLHAEGRGVVDHHRARLRRARRERLRRLAAGRGQHDIDVFEIEGVERLYSEDVVLAERDLPADRSG